VSNNPVLNWGCRQLMQIVLYNGGKTVVVVVVWHKHICERKSINVSGVNAF